MSQKERKSRLTTPKAKYTPWGTLCQVYNRQNLLKKERPVSVSMDWFIGGVREIVRAGVLIGTIESGVHNRCVSVPTGATQAHFELCATL